MSNIMGLLTIGQTALLAHQKAIDITGNNIANVNTEGYSRQTPEPGSEQPCAGHEFDHEHRCQRRTEHSAVL